MSDSAARFHAQSAQGRDSVTNFANAGSSDLSVSDEDVRAWLECRRTRQLGEGRRPAKPSTVGYSRLVDSLADVKTVVHSAPPLSYF